MSAAGFNVDDFLAKRDAEKAASRAAQEATAVAEAERAKRDAAESKQREEAHARAAAERLDEEQAAPLAAIEALRKRFDAPLSEDARRQYVRARVALAIANARCEEEVRANSAVIDRAVIDIAALRAELGHKPRFGERCIAGDQPNDVQRLGPFRSFKARCDAHDQAPTWPEFFKTAGMDATGNELLELAKMIAEEGGKDLLPRVPTADEIAALANARREESEAKSHANDWARAASAIPYRVPLDENFRRARAESENAQRLLRAATDRRLAVERGLESTNVDLSSLSHVGAPGPVAALVQRVTAPATGLVRRVRNSIVDLLSGDEKTNDDESAPDSAA